MVVCDKCHRRPARPFAYGDFVNSSYQMFDLCVDCTKELNELIWNFCNNKALKKDDVV